jgi:hypothetical protein
MANLLRDARRFLLIGLALAALAGRAGAHTLPISYLTLVPDADYLHLELALNPFELNFFSELDTNKDGRLEPAELLGRQELVTRRILSCLSVRVGGKAVAAEVAAITPDVDTHHVTLRAQYPADARRRPLDITSSLISITSGSHLTQVTYRSGGRQRLAQLDYLSTNVTFEPFEYAVAVISPASPAKRAGAPLAMLLALASLGLILLVIAGWRICRQLTH